MTLWDYLTWLWYQASKVLDWFGDQYNNFRDKVSNFWYYLGQWANSIYDTVDRWIIDNIDTLRTEFTNWYNSLVSWIDSIYLWIDTTIANIELGIETFVLPLLDRLRDDLTSWVNDIISGFIEWVDSIPAWLSEQIKALEGWILELINPILPLGNQTDKIFTMTEDNFFSRLLDLVQNGYATLRLFLDHPAGYIFNILIDKMLDYIGDVIGYGLGSVETELPDKKDWSK